MILTKKREIANTIILTIEKIKNRSLNRGFFIYGGKTNQIILQYYYTIWYTHTHI